MEKNYGEDIEQLTVGLMIIRHFTMLDNERARNKVE